MRSREFIMKDAYSFHLDYDSLQGTYDDMHRAYTAILDRLLHHSHVLNIKGRSYRLRDLEQAVSLRQ